MNFEKVTRSLEQRGFTVKSFATAEECASYIDETTDNASVGIGGSMSVGQLGVFERLTKHNEVYWHGNTQLVEKLGSEKVREMAAVSDVYLCSVNGLSENGEIINIDGCGNRIASTCFGHKRIILVVGKNKLAPNFEKAMWRARNIAAPLNAKRLGKNTPCAVKGDRCYDCNSPDRICRGFLIFERPLTSQSFEVLLVNENLGM